MPKWKLLGTIYLLMTLLNACNVAEQNPIVEDEAQNIQSNNDSTTKVLPVLRFQKQSSVSLEGSTDQTITVKRSLDTEEDITVTIYLTTTATYGVDFNNIKADGNVVTVNATTPREFSFTYPKDRTSLDITFDVPDDANFEKTETITFLLSGNETDSYTIIPYLSHVVQLKDDEIYPTVSFDLTSSSAAEGSAISIGLSLSNASDSTVIVPFNISGSASNSDHDLGTYYVTFTPGTTNTSISFNSLADALSEIDETLIFTLLNPSNATKSSSNNIHTHTINNSGTTTPEFNFLLSTDTIGDESTVSTYNLTLQLTGTIDESITVPFTISGTATNGQDYTLSKNYFTIPAGTNPSDTLTIRIKDDSLYEAYAANPSGDETIIFTVADVTKAIVGATNSITLTLQDNESATSPTYQFYTTTANTQEGSNYYLTIVSDKVASTDATFTYSISGASTASYPDDHALNPSSLPVFKMSAGSKIAQIAFYVRQDTLHDPDETIIFNLTATDLGSLGTNLTHTLTIRNKGTLPTINLSTSEQAIVEDDNLTITVNLDKASEHDQNFALTLTYLTASSSDHAAFNSSYTIPAGDTTYSFTINCPRDQIIERDEQFLITLKQPQNLALGSVTTQLITIEENDLLPEITLSKGADINETQSSFFTVTIQAGYTIDYNINIPFTLYGSATLSTDYTISKSDYFTLGRGLSSSTITVNGIEDKLAETITIETIGLQLDVPLANAVYQLAGGAQSQVLNLTDSDPLPTIEVLHTNITVGEGSKSFIFIQTEDGVISEQDITLNTTITGISGTTLVTADDFDIVSGKGSLDYDFTLPAGSSYIIFEFHPAEDKEIEGADNEIYDFTFNVDAGSLAYATDGASMTTLVSIIDRDSPVSFILDSGSPATSYEGGSANIVIMTEVAHTVDMIYEIEVEYLSASESITYDGETPSIADFTVTTGGNVVDMATTSGSIDSFQVTIPAGSTSTTIVFNQTDDTPYEGNEYLKFRISSMSFNGSEQNQYIDETRDQRIVRMVDEELPPTIRFDSDSSCGDFDSDDSVAEDSIAAINSADTVDGAPNRKTLCIELDHANEHIDLTLNLVVSGTAHWVINNSSEDITGDNFNDIEFDVWTMGSIPGSSTETLSAHAFSSYLYGDFAIYDSTNSALSDEEYVTNNTTYRIVSDLSIPAGSTSIALTIEIAKDLKYEEDEYIEFSLLDSTVNGISFPTTSDTRRLTIQDDETAPYLGIEQGTSTSAYSSIYSFNSDTLNFANSTTFYQYPIPSLYPIPSNATLYNYLSVLSPNAWKHVITEVNYTVEIERIFCNDNGGSRSCVMGPTENVEVDKSTGFAKQFYDSTLSLAGTSYNYFETDITITDSGAQYFGTWGADLSIERQYSLGSSYHLEITIP